MISHVHVDKKRIRLDPSRSIGKGGEADVYDLGDGRALKIFKTPDHPDYQGADAEQRAAEKRIAIHQDKLRRFPRGLPREVVAPVSLATDRWGKTVLGYAMPLVAGAEPLLRYGEPTYRRAFAPAPVVVDLFRQLWTALSAIHGAGVVVGDLNDLNVLVTPDHQVRFIDADSFQFDGFPCTVYTERFVDPRLCDPAGRAPVLAKPYDAAADWYAFTALLMQSLLFVGPFGGVFRPRDPAMRMPHGQRPLRRITVFHPEVQYPRPAVPYATLPDAMVAYLRRVFEEGERGPFPYGLFDALERPQASAPHAPAPVQGGTLRCESLFATGGIIVSVHLQGGDIRVVHFEGDRYHESGPGAASPKIWIEGAELRRAAPSAWDPSAFELVGEVLPNQTRIWLGPMFGFGFYRAGNLSRAFVFGVAKGGINDDLRLPPLRGQLIDVLCTLDEERAWFFVALSDGGRIEHHAFVFSRAGALLASAKAERGDGTWLGVFGGKCAAAGILLAATDAGVVKVEIRGGALEVTRRFAGTEDLVDERSQLFVGPRGLYVVSLREVRALRFN
jgi:hypothetical protein